MKTKAGASVRALRSVTALKPGATQVSASASAKRRGCGALIPVSTAPSIRWKTLAGERGGSRSVWPGRSISAWKPRMFSASSPVSGLT